ncbi:tubby like protein 8 [Actinidia rufa]|uniref:Tubby like protein 8 n=1 Tax=Actinidia rufa TaxID=165716 RepID=A0A7J0GM49_9ERIC|nr:tubby like protein 8 [Actinidia rufa]
MDALKKSSIPRQSSYNSLYRNPLTELKHYRSCSEGTLSEDKENFTPNKAKNPIHDKENADPNHGFFAEAEQIPSGKAYLRDRALKPSSLQLCMQINEPDSASGWSKIWDPIESDSKSSVNVWDYSDSEAAPASSWSTLPNRSLLCRPLPVDIGRCTCVIVKEASPEGQDGVTLYSLYTNEGKGRQDRKLAVAHHRRHSGRTEFVVAQNMKGICSSSDDSFIGIVTSNLMGSKYHVWDQGRHLNSQSKQSKSPLAVVSFIPTIATWTGSYRSMRISKQYELDFRDRTRSGLRIQSSVKNFQLVLEKNGRQTILQLGRVGKAKYVMDYRYPLTGFQAFCICLASIDTKLCCAL